MVTAETRGRVAAQQESGSLPWIRVGDPSDIQHLQAAHAVRLQETANFQFGGPGKFTRCNKKWRPGGLVVHGILVPSYLHDFDDANAKVGAERNPQKTESHLHRERPWCSTS